jgi:hypothetical protein
MFLVTNPGSGILVEELDVPCQIREAFWARIKRQHEAERQNQQLT